MAAIPSVGSRPRRSATVCSPPCGRLDRTLFGPPVPVAEDAVGQVVVPDDTPRREPLSPGHGGASRSRCSARSTHPAGGQLRPADREHRGPAVADAHEQRFHPPARPITSPVACSPKSSAGSESARRERIRSWPGSSPTSGPTAPEELDLAARASFADQTARCVRPASRSRNASPLTNLCQQLLTSNEFLYVD